MTGSPTNRTQGGVTLNGFVNANNSAASYGFEYGTSPALGSTTPPGSISGDTTQPVSAVLSGLVPSTLYYVRLSATNSLGASQSPLATFTTFPNGPPLVTTGAATGIGTSGATVAATVNPNGNATTYAFEFGPTAALGSSTATATLAAGETAQAVSAELTGLQPSTTYYYRVVATNSGGGPMAGSTGVFTTASPPPPPPPFVAPPNSPTTTLPAVVPAATGRTWSGTNGANLFRGTAGPDVIDGRGGNDRLFGGAGNDRLTGGGGRDVLDAGAGDDRILARDRTRDVVRCGRGRDTVIADRIDSIARDCEVVRRR
jgi:Ca2+-binding RTX toxin-like protein